MRIKDEIRVAGHFWLPSRPEKRISGTLSISDGGRIELEIIGLFDDSVEALNDDGDLGRVVGEVEKEGFITLDGCFYKSKNISFGGVSKSTIHVIKVLSGVRYEDGETVSFNTFQFSVEGIDEWVGISGIKVDNQYENRTATITYNPPENLSLDLKNGMQLLVTFYWTLPGSPNTTEAKITQKTYFKLVSIDERIADDFIDVAHKITTLLNFAIDKTVSLEHITATSNSVFQDIGDRESRLIPIKIYYASPSYSKDIPQIHWHQMLFRYGHIQANTEKIFNNWIDAYEKFDPALNLYFSTKTGTHEYLESKFLALVQGLETYHRRMSGEKLMTATKFECLVKSIINQCPTESQEWLEGRLKYGNEINLGKRIKRLIDPFKDIVGSTKVRDKIIRRIVDTRNYLTHYDESLKSKAADGTDLWVLCLKMEALFQLHFLQLLGFTQEEIKSIFENCYQLRQKLNKA